MCAEAFLQGCDVTAYRFSLVLIVILYVGADQDIDPSHSAFFLLASFLLCLFGGLELVVSLRPRGLTHVYIRGDLHWHHSWAGLGT